MAKNFLKKINPASIWRRIKNRPHLFFFYLFILSIPIGTRKVFLAQSLPAVDGFIEYANFFIYLSDLLIITTLFLWFVKRKRALSSINFKDSSPDSPPNLKQQSPAPERKIASTYGKILIILGLFLFWSFLTLIWAENKPIGLFQLVKLAEFILLFLFIQANITTPARFFYTQICLFLAGFFQSVMAIFQYLGQKSLGLSLLGESILGQNTAGVAKITVNGEKIVRVYGTLPHPNILGGFLILSILAGFYLIFKGFPFSKTPSAGKKWVLGIISIGLGIQIIGFILTFSRTAWAAIAITGLIFLGFYLKNHNKKPKFGLNKPKIAYFGFILLIFIITISLLWPQISTRFYLEKGDQALSLRGFYLKNSWEMIKQNPILGQGIGNFIFKLPPNLEFWQYQPVHNIYLLIFAELGIIGLVLFLFLLFLLIKRVCLSLKIPNSSEKAQKWLILAVFAGFLFIGLLDHYFWTIQAGQLSFWLVAGLLASSVSRET